MGLVLPLHAYAIEGVDSYPWGSIVINVGIQLVMELVGDFGSLYVLAKVGTPPPPLFPFPCHPLLPQPKF